MFRVEVSVKPGFPDPRGEALQKDIRDLGIDTADQVRVSDIYLLEGEPGEKEVQIICRELLADPVVEKYSIGEVPLVAVEDKNTHAIEVAYNPGVMDPVEGECEKRYPCCSAAWVNALGAKLRRGGGFGGDAVLAEAW